MRVDYIVGAEYDEGTGDTEPYKAPSEQTATDQQTQIDALNASVLLLANKIRTVTSASVTATTTDKTILANATTTAITITLPPVAGTVGQIITVKKIDISVNIVTLVPNASETIDGAATKIIATQWASLTIQSDGTGWFII